MVSRKIRWIYYQENATPRMFHRTFIFVDSGVASCNISFRQLVSSTACLAILFDCSQPRKDGTHTMPVYLFDPLCSSRPLNAMPLDNSTTPRGPSECSALYMDLCGSSTVLGFVFMLLAMDCAHLFAPLDVSHTPHSSWRHWTFDTAGNPMRSCSLRHFTDTLMGFLWTTFELYDISQHRSPPGLIDTSPRTLHVSLRLLCWILFTSHQ